MERIWKTRSTGWIRSSISQRFLSIQDPRARALALDEDVEKLWVQRQKYYGLEGSDAKPKDPMCPLTDGVSETISLTRGELIDLIERVVSNLKMMRRSAKRKRDECATH